MQLGPRAPLYVLFPMFMLYMQPCNWMSSKFEPGSLGVHRDDVKVWVTYTHHAPRCVSRELVP